MKRLGIKLLLLMTFPVSIAYAQWVHLNSGTTNFLFGQHFLNKDTGFVFGASTLLKTLDGGNSWDPISTPVSSDFTALDFFDDDKGILVGDAGIILKTIDARA